MLTKIDIEKGELQFYLLVTILSMFLLIDDVESPVEDAALILLSLPLLRRPVTVIPLLFISSWNMTFSVFGLGIYYYYYVVFLIAMSFSHHQFGEYIGLTRTALYYLLFAVWVLMSVFYSVGHVVDAPVKLFLTIMTVFFVSLFQCRDRNYIFVSLFWIAVVASLFFAIRALFFPAEYVLEIETWDNSIHSEVSNTLMTQLNPNSAAQIVVMLSIILFIFVVHMDRHKLLVLIPLLLNIYTLIFLGSRTSFYALCFSVGFYTLFISSFSDPHKVYLAFLCVLMAWGINYYIDYIESRLVVSSFMEDQGSGRFVTWALLWQDVIPRYWIRGFGVGFANYLALGYQFDADNMYIDLLCQVGIIGSILFYLQHFHTFRRIRAMEDDKTIIDLLVIISICFLFFGFGESVFSTTFYWGNLIILCTLGRGENDYVDSSDDDTEVDTTTNLTYD